MSKQERPEHRDPKSRASIKKQMIERALKGRLKACHGCDAVIGDGERLCPFCKAYRFDDRREAVLARIEKGFSKPVRWQDEVFEY